MSTATQQPAIQSAAQNAAMLEAIELVCDLETTTVYYDEDCYEIGLDHGWSYGGPSGADKAYRWEALLESLQQISADREQQGLPHLDALIKGIRDGRSDCDNMFLLEARAGQSND